MKVKIYSPSKSTIQSGKAKNNRWLLEPIEEENSHFINPLTGWVSCDSTISQIKLFFNNKEEAIKYANSKNWQYQVMEPEISRYKKKSYASNFS
jgi:hypothetical protein